jgi:hypothetical protein
MCLVSMGSASAFLSKVGQAKGKSILLERVQVTEATDVGFTDSFKDRRVSRGNPDTASLPYPGLFLWLEDSYLP